jgi:hypothetical protein
VKNSSPLLRFLIGAVVVAAVACGSDGASGAGTAAATTVAPTTTVPETPEQAFLATVRQAGLGDTDMDDPSNHDAMVEVGKHNVCGLFDDGASYGDVAEGIIGAKQRHPTGEQVKVFITAAVENFCPRHTASLP